jgi:hypothetical protein
MSINDDLERLLGRHGSRKVLRALASYAAMCAGVQERKKLRRGWGDVTVLLETAADVVRDMEELDSGITLATASGEADALAAAQSSGEIEIYEDDGL